jgi:hypothetical protein
VLRFVEGNGGDVLEIRASGRLTSDDYRLALAPRLDAALRTGKKLKVLFLMDETFAGWTPGAAWLNTVVDVRHRKDFGKLAIVGAPAWEEWCLKLAGLLIAGEIRSFTRDQLDLARAWLRG